LMTATSRSGRKSPIDNSSTDSAGLFPRTESFPSVFVLEILVVGCTTGVGVCCCVARAGKPSGVLAGSLLVRTVLNRLVESGAAGGGDEGGCMIPFCAD
jgi:hypothetical protein